MSKHIEPMSKHNSQPETEGPNMSTLGQRLNKALRVRNKSKIGLARFCGVSKAAVTQWTNESTNDLKMHNLFSAAKFLDIRPEWLATGKGPMDGNVIYVNQAHLTDVPIVPENKIAEYFADIYEATNRINTAVKVSPKAFATQIKDVASKEVNEKQVFIVDPEYTVKEGARIALISSHGVFMIRDVIMDGPAVFFSGGRKDWAATEVEYIGGLCSVAEQSVKTSK